MSQGKIHIRTKAGLEVWTWRSGGCNIVIRDPDRKSYVADCLSVSQASCWDDVVITPAVVRKYIEDVIKRGKHLKKGAICFRGPKAWSPRGVDPGRFRTK